MNNIDITKNLVEWLYLNNYEVYTTNKTLCNNNFIPDIIIKDINGTEYNAIILLDTTNIEKIIPENKEIIQIIKQLEDKNITYQIEHIRDKTIHKNINIENLILATTESINGKLFNETETKENINPITKKIYPNHPKKEYIKTKLYIRTLWKEWNKNKLDTNKIGIGILLSEKLDIETDNPKPKFFIQMKNRHKIIEGPNGLELGKEQWSPRWTKLVQGE